MAQITRRSLRRSETGAELVEFALVLPILLFLIGGILDFARLFHSYEVVTNAAREGSRLASLPGYEINGYQTVRNRVQQYVYDTHATGTLVTVVDPVPVAITLIGDPPTPAGSGIRVTVTYTHDFWFIGPIFAVFGGTFRDNLTYQVSSVTRTEMQVPLPAPGGTP